MLVGGNSLLYSVCLLLFIKAVGTIFYAVGTIFNRVGTIFLWSWYCFNEVGTIFLVGTILLKLIPFFIQLVYYFLMQLIPFLFKFGTVSYYNQIVYYAHFTIFIQLVPFLCYWY